MPSTRSAIPPSDEYGDHVASTPLLEVSDLSVDYAVSDGTVCAVDRVSFDVDMGEFVAIVGESGCGKSTLLFAIAHLLTPPAATVTGSVRFLGNELVTMNDKELRALRWKHYSVVMQSA